jgi:serine/threonine protein kinase
MGVVYRAYDMEVGEAVAIKTLRPELGGLDPTLLDRFKQELRLARRITHRNVVRTYDLGEVDGVYYITMELVRGVTVAALIREAGRLAVPATLTIGKQVCRALEVAHEEGIVHRDIKPQNLLVDPSGFLKVMDFGIARLAERPVGGGQLTAAGVVVGTPQYMAPEQLFGEPVDGRSGLRGTQPGGAAGPAPERHAAGPPGGQWRRSGTARAGDSPGPGAEARRALARRP